MNRILLRSFVLASGCCYYYGVAIEQQVEPYRSSHWICVISALLIRFWVDGAIINVES